MLNVGVLVGGRSVEHEVAVITAMQMIENLDKTKYNIFPIYINNTGKWLVGEGLDKFETYKSGDFAKFKEVFVMPSHGDKSFYTLNKKSSGGGLFSKQEDYEVLEKYCTLDVAVLGLHGTNSEDGTIQGLLDTMGIPYTGGNVLASSVGMDKVLMKDVYRQNGIPTVEYCWFYRDEWLLDPEKILINIEKLKYPLIVKPSNLGSSIGITKAKDKNSLLKAIEIAIFYDDKIIIEEAIENLREINCAVLGRQENVIASILEEPIGWVDVQTFENKYEKGGGATRKLPADVPDEIRIEIEELAKQAFKVINCAGTARIDFLLEDNEKVYVNEINTLPGSTSYHLWEKTGISFKELMDRLIEIALDESKEKEKNMVTFESDLYLKTSYGTKGASIK
ncbi:MAG: D-alanine--D-alanine ligase [Tissierellia bacterium]|nr:D-alanine--D-alanine ligase [Tissierellia bacterium]